MVVVSGHPRVHGRDHRAGGADPIPGFEDSLHWGENTDTSSLGLTLNATADVVINADSSNITLTAEFIDLTQVGGSGELTIQSDGELNILSDDEIQNNAPSFSVQVAAKHVFEMGITAGRTRFDFPAGGTLVVRDSAFATIFKVAEATGLTTATIDGGSP